MMQRNIPPMLRAHEGVNTDFPSETGQHSREVETIMDVFRCNCWRVNFPIALEWMWLQEIHRLLGTS